MDEGKGKKVKRKKEKGKGERRKETRFHTGSSYFPLSAHVSRTVIYHCNCVIMELSAMIQHCISSCITRDEIMACEMLHMQHDISSLSIERFVLASVQ